MAPIYKIALIQMQAKPVDPAANFVTAASHIRAAASQGSHLAVLPEYHLTGWVPDNASFISASAESTSYLARYQDLARELDIAIVPGTICEVHAAPQSFLSNDSAAAAAVGGTDEGPELRNMAYFISARTGSIAGTYQKKNLWHPERPHLTGSAFQPHSAFDTTLPPIRRAASSSSTDDKDATATATATATTTTDSRPVRAGLLVCWDLAFPEAFRALVADGADVIVVPSCWAMDDVDGEAQALGGGNSERVFLEACVVARACESAVAVVYVNTGGLSQVAVPLLGALGKMEPGVDGMAVVDVDMDVLRVAEDNYRVREDMARDGWHYGYTLPGKAVEGG